VNVIIYPRSLSGSINVPSSKSQTHRAVIAAALAKGKSTISNINYSDDILATIGAMEKIGAKFIKNPGQLIVNGSGKVAIDDDNFVECNESGSTLRFVTPLFALSKQKIVFTGKKSLFQRPMGVYEDIFKQMNLQYQKNEDSLIVSGELLPGRYEIPGNISSQFISGLMFSLPLLKEDSELVILEPYESKGYVDMTIDVLGLAGISVEATKNGYYVKGNQSYKPINIKIEGDYSQMAVYAVMGVLGNDLFCRNMVYPSLQPDSRIIDFIRNSGGQVEVKDSGIQFCKSETKAAVYDVSQSPDIAPILAILAAFSKGESRIINAQRLKYKESNRLLSTYTMLQTIGVEVEMTDDELIIKGVDDYNGGLFDSFNDHRIVMASAASSIRSTKQITIKDAQAVNKSYPDFFSDLIALGASVDLIEE
jgi:3-phosphoshikimate 1-carboxyvinyltransferase